MINISFGLGFLLANAIAAFIIHLGHKRHRKLLVDTVRNINERWRAYEQATEPLYALRGFNNALLVALSIDKKISFRLQQDYLMAHQSRISKPEELPVGSDEQTTRQWLTNRKTDITNKLQSIYDEHNATGLLRRKDG